MIWYIVMYNKCVGRKERRKGGGIKEGERE